MKNVKYGKCVRCGKTYDAVPDLTNCECGGILDIVYDYDYIKSVLTKEKLARAGEPLHVALPGAAARGGDYARHAPAGGLEPPVRGAEAGRSCWASESCG